MIVLRLFSLIIFDLAKHLFLPLKFSTAIFDFTYCIKSAFGLLRRVLLLSFSLVLYLMNDKDGMIAMIAIALIVSLRTHPKSFEYIYIYIYIYTHTPCHICCSNQITAIFVTYEKKKDNAVPSFERLADLLARQW